jgi:hypothetical protein
MKKAALFVAVAALVATALLAGRISSSASAAPTAANKAIACEGIPAQP